MITTQVFTVDSTPTYPIGCFKMTGAARDVDVYCRTDAGAVRVATEHPVGDRLRVTVYGRTT